MFENHVKEVIWLIEQGYHSDEAIEVYIMDLVDAEQIDKGEARELKDDLRDALSEYGESQLSLIGMSEKDFL